ncbi:uncharacterized protein ATC70_000866 [Mucor velutinosus]|uniref:Sugar phosphate transporter domain-containing protein n=1 Tax=Mucor velutinosus TaxID=708070 RepID=A0AAN7DIB4_9FUNG|nr:hypothetical protein ATC70_000866 [Mucor velutinosus]
MSTRMGGLPLPTGSLSGKSTGGAKLFMSSNGSLFLTVSLYITVSILATFINKLLFTYSEYKFPYPCFTVLFQLAITLVFMVVWSLVRPLRHSILRIPTPSWDSSVAIRVAPLTIVYICVIIFNPLFLQHVEITTYHFAHSLTIAFSILFSYLMLRIEQHQRIVSACVVIMFGTSIGAMGNLNFSLVGAFYSISWPAIVALYGIYVKKTLSALRSDLWALVQYNTIMSIAIMVPLVILSGELDDIFSTVWFWDEFGFWLQMLITAMTGFAVNIAMLLLLMQTSPLTLTVASVCKTSIQALVVAVIFGNRMTLLNLSGMLITLMGSIYYSYIRSIESKL